MPDLYIFIYPGIGIFSVFVLFLIAYFIRKRRANNRTGNLIINDPKKVGLNLGPPRLNAGIIDNVCDPKKSTTSEKSHKSEPEMNAKSFPKCDHNLSALSANSGTINSVLLQKYRRFYDEPLIIVEDLSQKKPIGKTNQVSNFGQNLAADKCYENAVLAFADDTVSNYSLNSQSTEFSLRRDGLGPFFGHNGEPYVSDPYFSLQLDREQLILAQSRKNVKILDDDQISDSHKLRRELAEAIAEDKIQENTVTFTYQQDFAVENDLEAGDKQKLSHDFEVIARERTAV